MQSNIYSEDKSNDYGREVENRRDLFGRRTQTKSLDFDLRPFSLFKTDRCKEVTGNLISQNTKPDTDDSKTQGISEEIGNNGSDNGYADCRRNRCKKGISGTAQTSHIDNLKNLKNYYENDHIHDLYTDRYNMLFFEEKAEKTTGSKK